MLPDLPPMEDVANGEAVCVWRRGHWGRCDIYLPDALGS